MTAEQFGADGPETKTDNVGQVACNERGMAGILSCPSCDFYYMQMPLAR